MAKDKSDEYKLFLELIPKDTRERVSKTIKDAPLETLSDFTYMCSSIISEILSGNIPPSVADSAQPYAELMYTAIVSRAKGDKATQNAQFSTVLSRLQEASNNAKSLEAKYVVDDSFVEPQKDKVIINAE